MSSDTYDYLFKVIIVGDSETGKTNILSRYTQDKFTPGYICTIGVDFGTKVVSYDGKQIKVQVWDTAGQERYMAITKAYYRGAVGALILYDVTNKQSFGNVEKWLSQLKEYNSGLYTETTPVVVVGNKCDLEASRVVTTMEGASFAKKNELLFIETSAKDNKNIDQAFELLCKVILKNVIAYGVSQPAPQNAVSQPAPQNAGTPGTSHVNKQYVDAYDFEGDEETLEPVAVIDVDSTKIPSWAQDLADVVLSLKERVDVLGKLENKVDQLCKKVETLETKVEKLEGKSSNSVPKKVDFKTAHARSVKKKLVYLY